MLEAPNELLSSSATSTSTGTYKAHILGCVLGADVRCGAEMGVEPEVVALWSRFPAIPNTI